MAPRDPTDSREAPYCRRCGGFAEPGDFLCWRCGGEELVLSGEVVAHTYGQAGEARRGEACLGWAGHGMARITRGPAEAKFD